VPPRGRWGWSNQRPLGARAGCGGEDRGPREHESCRSRLRRTVFFAPPENKGGRTSSRTARTQRGRLIRTVLFYLFFPFPAGEGALPSRFAGGRKRLDPAPAGEGTSLGVSGLLGTRT